MSASAKEWVLVSLFVLLLVGSTVGEAVWLNRKGWAGFGKSLIFSVLTNFIGYAVGFFVLFVIIVVLLAMAWGGSLEEFPMKEYGLMATLGLGLLFTPVLLTACKGVLLLLLKIQTGISVWIYAVVSSVLSLMVSVGIPVFIGYIIV